MRPPTLETHREHSQDIVPPPASVMATNQSSETLSSFSTLRHTPEAHRGCSEKETSDRHNVKGEYDGPVNLSKKGAKESSSIRGNAIKLGDADTIPDGGLRAWLVVLGVVSSLFTAFGFISSWGVFQAFYETTFLQDSSPTGIAWIGSVQYALIFIPSMVVGRLFDKGYFLPLFISFGAVLVSATIFLVQCTLYWHVFVCQGIIIGLSCGVITATAPALISQWFKEKRPFALGIAACGSATGGTVWPIVIRAMLPRVGFQWTMRVIGLIILGLLTISGLTMRRRLPPSRSMGSLIGLTAFKTPAYVMWCFATLFVYIGFCSFQSYVASTAISKGFSKSFSFTLVAIMNGSSGMGRILAGYVASRAGSVNHMVPSTIAAAAVILAWPAAMTYSSLVVISALYGLFAGSYAALLFNPILDLGQPEELSSRVGILMLFLALAGLVGPPISGAVEHAAGMRVMSIFAAGCTLIGVILACVTRHMLLKTLLGKI